MQWLHELSACVLPDLCEVCDTTLVHGEHVICLGCRTALPRTLQHRDDFNDIHRRLASDTPIDRAASYFYYIRGNRYVRLIHAAKYEGRPRVGRSLAADFARELLPDGFFDGIDLIIPVPLHAAKLRRRGYNQSEEIARGLADVSGIAVADNLVAVRDHSTQTRKSAYERLLNAIGTYEARRPEELADRHVLIVDDVLTTGATLTACCKAVHTAAPTARISVLTLAMTHRE